MPVRGILTMGHFDWGNWLYGLLTAVITGGANAVVGGVSLNLVDPSHFNAQNADLYKVVWTLFLANGTMSFFLFLKQQPLPKLVERTTETHTIEKTIAPAPLDQETPRA